MKLWFLGIAMHTAIRAHDCAHALTTRLADLRNRLALRRAVLRQDAAWRRK